MKHGLWPFYKNLEYSTYLSVLLPRFAELNSHEFTRLKMTLESDTEARALFDSDYEGDEEKLIEYITQLASNGKEKANEGQVYSEFAIGYLKELRDNPDAKTYFQEKYQLSEEMWEEIIGETETLFTQEGTTNKNKRNFLWPLKSRLISHNKCMLPITDVLVIQSVLLVGPTYLILQVI